MDKNKDEKTSEQGTTPFAQTYFHGTKADLKIVDLIEAGFNSNYGQRNNAKYIFLSATLDAAIWGAKLAYGDGRERIYLVEATGEIENDPDLTDRKFPGNPTKFYRSTQPFRVAAQGNWNERNRRIVENGLATAKNARRIVFIFGSDHIPRIKRQLEVLGYKVQIPKRLFEPCNNFKVSDEVLAHFHFF